MIYAGDPDADTRTALPEPRRAANGFTVLPVCGALGPLGVAGFAQKCRQLRRDDSVRRVLITIDSLASVVDVDDAEYAVRRLAESKLTIGLIVNAVGMGYRLVAGVRALFAAPTATIGELAVVEAGEPWAICYEHDQRTVAAIADARPDVRWERLLRSTVNGEQAEAMGVVDGLVVDEASLIAKFRKVQT